MWLPTNYLLLPVVCDAFFISPTPLLPICIHIPLDYYLPRSFTDYIIKGGHPVPIIVTYSFHPLCVEFTYNHEHVMAGSAHMRTLVSVRGGARSY